jgi:hypothetical protein
VLKMGLALLLPEGGRVMPQTAFKYELEVQEGGKVELNVPLSKGTLVAVFVVEESEDDFGDLISAAQSSLDFWDNPIDDEVWNNA